MPLLGSIGSDSKGNYGYDRVTYNSNAFYSGMYDTNGYNSTNVGNGWYPYDSATAIDVDANNNTYIVGSGSQISPPSTVSPSEPPPTFGYVAKYNSLGNVLWIKALMTTGVTYTATSVKVGPLTGNVYVSGMFNETFGGSTAPNLYMSAFDTNGNLLWFKGIWNGSSGNVTYIQPHCLAVTENEEIYMACSVTSGYINTSFLQWSKTGSLISATMYQPPSDCTQVLNTNMIVTALGYGNGYFLISAAGGSAFNTPVTFMPVVGGPKYNVFNTNRANSSFVTSYPINSVSSIFYDSFLKNLVWIGSNSAGSKSYLQSFTANNNFSNQPGSYLGGWGIDTSVGSAVRLACGASTVTNISGTDYATYNLGGVTDNSAFFGQLICGGTQAPNSLVESTFQLLRLQESTTSNFYSFVNDFAIGSSTLINSGSTPKGVPLFMATTLTNGINYVNSSGKVSVTYFGSNAGLYTWPSRIGVRGTTLTSATRYDANYPNQNPVSSSSSSYNMTNTVTSVNGVALDSGALLFGSLNSFSSVTDLLSSSIIALHTGTVSVLDALKQASSGVNGFGSYVNATWTI